VSLPRPLRVMSGRSGESTDAADIPTSPPSYDKAPGIWAPPSPAACSEDVASEAVRTSFISFVECSCRGRAEDACCATR